jgi:hypothetical protein
MTTEDEFRARLRGFVVVCQKCGSHVDVGGGIRFTPEPLDRLKETIGQLAYEILEVYHGTFPKPEIGEEVVNFLGLLEGLRQKPTNAPKTGQK